MQAKAAATHTIQTTTLPASLAASRLTECPLRLPLRASARVVRRSRALPGGGTPREGACGRREGGSGGKRLFPPRQRAGSRVDLVVGDRRVELVGVGDRDALD